MMPERKVPHIALVNLQPVLNSVGGVEKVFCRMASDLVEKGFKVSPIICDEKLSDQLSFPILEKPINAYVKPKFSFIYKKPYRTWFTYALSTNNRKKKRLDLTGRWQAECLQKVLQKLPPIDAVISFQIPTTYLLKKFLDIKAPIVTMLHNQPSRFYEKIELCKEYLAQTEGILVLLPEYIPEISEKIPNLPVYCIPNAVPELNFNVNYSEHRIINISRLSSQKRPDLLINAFALLKDQFPDWVCEWWGPTENVHFYEELIRKNQLTESFFLMGKTSDIVNKLSTASIYAFPSSYEGFPLSLTEAMSFGLPTVGCRDCQAVSSLIKNGVNGVLTEASPVAYSEGLKTLMQSMELREKLGKHAKEDMKVYSPQVVTSMWEDLILKLIKDYRKENID